MGSPSIQRGRSFPLGATLEADGVNFCIYSRDAAAVELLLFNSPADASPSSLIRLESQQHRTGDYWHVLVPGLAAGQLYGYRVAGSSDARAGARFDPQKLLVDPYALAVANTAGYVCQKAAEPGDNAATALKSVVVDPHDYDWAGDQPLERPFIDSTIYELHVAGFTSNPNSGIASERRGTYTGLVEAIPYLVDLGIKTVELMPVQQFDPQAAPHGVNYWGYQPIAWFAPHRQYCAASDVLAPVREFRDLVKALHRAEIEVIIDVVFNHTAEGDGSGPTLSWRGLDNSAYYLLDGADPSRYIDDTGCGNTVNGNEPVVTQLILDCLRYWVQHMHVDGFRFDLGASLSRGVDGRPLTHPPVLDQIEADPVLAGTKIIAEAWDAAGLYELASFGSERWSVWNGQFRDHVRRFVSGQTETVAPLADNIVASANLFHHEQRLPSRSINFVTAHDGFTLNDLVSYDHKHNEANGESNRDGSNADFSWNCGVEGPTEDPVIQSLRNRQLRNLLTILFMSEGRPMLSMGDEVRRTQHGNNNAYCQDNATSWFDWDDLHRHADFHRFTQELIRFHQQSSIFRDRTFWGEPMATQITWHGLQLDRPDWNGDSHSLAFELLHQPSGEHVDILLNAYWDPLSFELPKTASGRVWRRLIDTSLDSPRDICPTPPALAQQKRYICQARSSVVLVSGPAD
jgi:glycogen operon protein